MVTTVVWKNGIPILHYFFFTYFSGLEVPNDRVKCFGVLIRSSNGNHQSKTANKIISLKQFQ